jgi:glyoxylase-like metal-dependent hydrolase (beta-lactamase superfamily II)
MTIPLEDLYTDIIGKAIRGLKLDDATVAQRAGVSVAELESLRAGEFSAAVAEKVAPVLQVNARCLAALAQKRYAPASVTLEGLEQFNTVFEDMTVNAYLAWDPVTRDAAIFDTGTDVGPILATIAVKGLKLRDIFITHTHGDHIFDLDRLREKKKDAAVWTGEKEPVDGATAFAPGRTWQVGGLKVESRSTWGHCPGGITYVVTGLARPVAVVGDSIFAGSMGGGGISYPDAVKNNLEQILTLPANTVICPGHGPLTSVGEEQKNNAFFAK